MYIHLADSSKERGQYLLAAKEAHCSGLLSYAYRSGEENLSIWWNELLNLHLAGLPSRNGEIQSQVLPEIESHLTTYADPHEVKVKEKIFTNLHLADNPDRIPDLRPRVIIDSGAFTAFTTGKTIDPRDYAKWSLDFELRWEGKMQALHFMNLDVIGDQDASWVNQSKIEALGLNVLPIVTYGADKKHLIRAIENYEYIALGGLVPWSRQKDKLKAWLDYCFSIAMAQHKKTGVMPRIHLLGITQDWVLKRYPCYSSDSSSWVACLRFGGGAAAGLKQLPRYKESEAALSATIHTLRCEIQKYKKMQDDATNLWTKRGITFND